MKKQTKKQKRSWTRWATLIDDRLTNVIFASRESAVTTVGLWNDHNSTHNVKQKITFKKVRVTEV